MISLPEIRQMTGTEIAISCAAFLSVVCPGVLAVWIFAPHLAESLTTPKLLLLGSSFTAPVLAFNTISILLFMDRERERKQFQLNPWFSAFVQGAGGTIGITFALLFFHIFTGTPLPQLLMIFLLGEVAAFVYLAIERAISIRRSRKAKQKYLMEIVWSEEDEAYVGRVPALEGCISHGDTYPEAAKNLQEAMELWLESAEKHGDPISKK